MWQLLKGLFQQPETKTNLTDTFNYGPQNLIMVPKTFNYGPQNLIYIENVSLDSFN